MVLKRGRLKSELLKEYLLSLFAFSVVQFYPLLKFYFPICFKVINKHYHIQKQRIKFKPRIKTTIYTYKYITYHISDKYGV